MIHIEGDRCCLLIALLAALGGSADRAVATSDQPVSPAAAEARRTMDRVLSRYRALKTYQDEFELKTIVIAKNANGHDASTEQSQRGSLSFARPSQMSLVLSSGFELLCDGQKLWTVGRDMGWALGHHYTQKRVSQAMDLPNAITEFLADSLAIHPVAQALSHPSARFDEVFPRVQSITAVTDKSTQGRAGQLVAGTMAFARLSFRQAVPFRAWFAESDGLLHEMHIDVTNAVRQMLSARRIAVEKAELVFSLDKVVADRELPIPRFTFKPGTDDEHVDAIVPVARVDRPAIGFNGTDMNGRSLSSKDLRGRVVLLDFWASWCGPCLVAMPQVQRLADKFADKPVAIVGINNDESNNVEKAKLVVQRREITFRQYMDTDSVVSRAYQIPGLPFSVLIDRKGVVRYTHFGLMPRFESEMTHQIEQLLAAGD